MPKPNYDLKKEIELVKAAMSSGDPAAVQAIPIEVRRRALKDMLKQGAPPRLITSRHPFGIASNIVARLAAAKQFQKESQEQRQDMTMWEAMFNK